jgi:hypothetical protein
MTNRLRSQLDESSGAGHARHGENRDQLFGWYPGRECRGFLAQLHSGRGYAGPKIRRTSNHQLGPIGAHAGYGLTSAASSALRPSYQPPRHRLRL